MLSAPRRGGWLGPGPWVLFGVLGASLAAAALGGSCVLGSFELVDAGAPAQAGGAAAPGGAGGGGSPGCVLAKPVSAPDKADPKPDDVELVAALRTIDFGDGSGQAGPDIGYDLDGFCTCCSAPCPSDGPSCKYAPWADPSDQCDGPGGLDNSAGLLLSSASAFSSSLTSAEQNKGIAKGAWSLLLRVRQYNGKADDAQVVVSAYPSPGLEHDPCNGLDPKPKWDGEDRWPVSASALVPSGGGGGTGGAGGCADLPGYDLDHPRYLDHNAYVSGWVLVANMPEAGVEIAGEDAAATIRLTGGYATGRLVKRDAGGWAIEDGMLVGRWKVAEFFQVIGSFAAGGEEICVGSYIYKKLKEAVCRQADILSDVKGPTTPCDALSFAMAFPSAEPARLGRIVAPAPATNQCPPDKDPANDNCESKE